MTESLDGTLPWLSIAGWTASAVCLWLLIAWVNSLVEEEDRSYMDFGLMQRELKRWYDEGYRSVGFLGGEPTLLGGQAGVLGFVEALLGAG